MKKPQKSKEWKIIKIIKILFPPKPDIHTYRQTYRRTDICFYWVASLLIRWTPAAGQQSYSTLSCLKKNYTQELIFSTEVIKYICPVSMYLMFYKQCSGVHQSWIYIFALRIRFKNITNILAWYWYQVKMSRILTFDFRLEFKI